MVKNFGEWAVSDEAKNLVAALYDQEKSEPSSHKVVVELARKYNEITGKDVFPADAWSEAKFTKDFSSFISKFDRRANSPEDIEAIPAGAIIAFIAISKDTQPSADGGKAEGRRALAHAMISLGDGKAIGFNNAQGIFGEAKSAKGSNDYSVIDLAKELAWRRVKTSGWGLKKGEARETGYHQRASIDGAPHQPGMSRLLRIRYHIFENEFRRTPTILPTKKPIKQDEIVDVTNQQADAIMTTAALGFCKDWIERSIEKDGDMWALQFDIDHTWIEQRDRLKKRLKREKNEVKKREISQQIEKLDKKEPKELEKERKYKVAVSKLVNVLKKEVGFEDIEVGVSPANRRRGGGVIAGVGVLVGDERPLDAKRPRLSGNGQSLLDEIVAKGRAEEQYYYGRGAYSGLVDSVTTGAAFGPYPTARFLVRDDGEEGATRWLPAADSSVWNKCTRGDETKTRVPWGLIGGDFAAIPDEEHGTLADKMTHEMHYTYKMRFIGEPQANDIAAYPHGMIQAIYKAYGMGPSFHPYEIAVGELTTKLSSCLPCSFFMFATGYPPNSIHLNRGESWSPLFEPFMPLDESGAPCDHSAIEQQAINALNDQWYAKCDEWMNNGISLLENSKLLEDSHTGAFSDLKDYLKNNDKPKVCGTLILDAITMHDSEYERFNRAIKD